ncbi:MAG: class I SAM-dependent methyltransferase, partial [Chloroflexota bacterium]
MQHPNFFSENSPFLQHPLLTPERTAQEVAFIVSQLGLSSGARILDIGCGFGRHSIALSEYGYQVTGIDPAEAMITAAKYRARGEENSVEFHQIRGEDFTTDQLYAGAICLFTSLGQISASGENSRLVERAYQALELGGKFIVEVPQREVAVQQLKPTDRFGSDETYTDITRQYNAGTHTVTEEFILVAPDSQQ